MRCSSYITASRSRGGSTLATALAVAMGIVVLGGSVFMSGCGGDEFGGIGGLDGGALRVRVEKGDLTISALAAGSLQTRRTTSVSNDTGRALKIIYLVDNGELVKEGDLLVELETTELEDLIVRQEIDVENARDAVTRAETEKELTIEKNKVDLLTADNRKIIAEIDKEKYEEGDFEKTLMDNEARVKDLTARLSLAEEDLSQAEIDLVWTEKLFAQGFEAERNLKRDRQAVERQKVNLAKTGLDLLSAEKTLELLKRFDYLKQTTQFDTNLAQVDSNQQRMVLQSQRDLNRLESSLTRARSELTRKEEMLEKTRGQLIATKIYAPTGGMVVHQQRGGGSRRGYPMGGGGQDEMLEIGTTVNPRQKLINLPDFSDWIVEARVKESMIQKVREGQRVFVTLDALPDAPPIMGTVWQIATLPDQGNWMRSVLEYIVKINMEEAQESFKPGMSAKVEIIVKELQDRLLVPVEAVNIDEEGKYVVWVLGETGPMIQEVKVGENNDRFIEIASGLSEGQEVILDELSSRGAGLGSRPATLASAEQRQEAGEAALEAESSGERRGRGGRRGGGRGGEGRGGWGGFEGRGGGSGGFDFSSMPPEMREQIMQRMQNASPEERQRMEQMMGQSGGDKPPESGADKTSPDGQWARD